MGLSSLHFVFIFLPVFLVIYLVGSQQLKVSIILVASIIFLAWGERTAVLWLTGLIIFGYFMGLVISKTEGKKYPLPFGCGLQSS